MGFITPEGLKALKEYKYVSGGYSFFDKIMNHWWEFFVKLIPMSVAPNLITLTGLIINISATVAYLYYDMTFSQPVPQWVYFYAAFCAFMYQTLDAVDGKQARRTGTSSPLGQLFDHGCDAVCVFFGLINFLQAVRTGTTWMMFAIMVALTLTFYTQQWEEYHAHVLRTFIGWFGVTEGILITLATILTVAFTNGGLAVWTFRELLPASLNLPEIVGSLTIPQVVAGIALYNAFSYAVSNITYALEKTSESKVGALLGLMPIVLFYGEVAVMFGCTEWAWKYPSLALLLVFPSYCLMTCRHIICSVTKMRFNWRQKNPFWFLLFVVNRYALTCIPSLKQFQVKGSPEGSLVPECWVASAVFAITLFLFIRFVVEVIGQITSYLNINCLTIKKKAN